MRVLFSFLVVLAALGAAVAYFSLFVVHQTQQALVLQFGEPKREIKDPGLYFKIPVAQSVEFFDKRILDLDTRPQEVIASDQKRLVVDSFARYKIVDPLLFFQTVRDERIARSRLDAVLDSGLRRVLGSATFEEVVRDAREDLMAEITRLVNVEAKGFGVKIVDVRIKRADLPEANSQAIYRRMQTERQREAAEIRAQGEEASRRIRANANRQVTVVKAEATRESEMLRGEGEAKRTKILADSFGEDPDFFSFYRSMQAYEQGLQSKDTRLVITPNTDFFRYFTDPEGKAAARGSAKSGAVGANQ